MKRMAAREQQREMMSSEDESSPVCGDLRRGPWTVEEDLLLVNYVAAHGEGRWNALARCAGLKRTGKSCRLRWLNYLRPDLRRGNMTAQEQLLILELHSRWGNRWSKIAQHLPGRTDNEIKNYWRTRVQKHARQLGCDVSSQQFKDLMRYIWMPRLLERIHHSDDSSGSSPDATPPPAPFQSQQQQYQQQQLFINNNEVVELSCVTAASSSSVSTDDGGMAPAQQQPLMTTTPAMNSSGGGNGWSSSCSDNNNSDDSIMSIIDTWCQPPHTTTAADYNNPAAQYLGETCSWSDAGGLSTTGVLATADMMASSLPDLGETAMWGAADDLWYTQIMGL